MSQWTYPDPVSDEALVRRARDGEEAALSALVKRHTDAVYRVALAIAGDPDLAQDVSQEAFVKAFRGLGGFRGDASFRTWLLTIAANAARGALRRQGRRREMDLESAPPMASEARGPDQDAELSAEAARAREALLRLPEKQRLSIQLRVDEGLSFREIAEVIGSTEGAARVNYFHGIRKLREWME
ncbi:MAG: sigma-70 family RNA polymerase sigma factor [Gemmatimonadetes bacterium]|nr:sigma-70 family RNA polymerase sigma factor [Gemmatimonadota bacterium]